MKTYDVVYPRAEQIVQCAPMVRCVPKFDCIVFSCRAVRCRPIRGHAPRTRWTAGAPAALWRPRELELRRAAARRRRT